MSNKKINQAGTWRCTELRLKLVAECSAKILTTTPLSKNCRVLYIEFLCIVASLYFSSHCILRQASKVILYGLTSVYSRAQVVLLIAMVIIVA